jgi:hypothetical protein
MRPSNPAPVLPDPRLCPVLSIAAAGRALNLSRSAAYERAASGVLPTISIGRGRRVVPVARLRQLVGLPAEPATPLEQAA